LIALATPQFPHNLWAGASYQGDGSLRGTVDAGGKCDWKLSPGHSKTVGAKENTWRL